ncbi:phosphonate metabolism transcriptional regulator PhnF [Ancylobacter lacus]|uniref:phosphonate metabolism transcriptional regulator PhnF n=1 Tax=Ancylobacter lacus TaxID=2579970 RepID=UPI001BCE8624|nr:phosphonate metabolism transcriptional regulator PhnF [Ancylobacter lacus]MBS7537781.1 phosphonate metabolism transcriptional regulator PhnF [Ancylobacter lacus]
MDEFDNDPVTPPTPAATVERGSGISLWKQIAEQLAAEIADGRLQPGARLPTEAEMAERFGVNRHTLRRALAALSEGGVVEATPGRGTFVKEPPIRYPISARTRFSEIVSGEGRAPGGRFLSAQREPATAELAAALKIPAGTELLRIEMVREADGVPIVCGTHWYSAERCRDLEFLVAATGSVTRALEALGLGDYRRLETRITARPADEQERGLLALPAGRVVMVVESINGDARRTPIQFTRSRFAADRVQLLVKN